MKTAIKQLSLSLVALKSFEYLETKYEQGQTYFIISEYSDDDPSDVIETSKWVVDMLMNKNVKLLHPHTLLPESNMIDRALVPYMESLIDYIRTNLG